MDDGVGIKNIFGLIDIWFGLTPQAPLAATPQAPPKNDREPAVTHALKYPLTYSQSGFI